MMFYVYKFSQFLSFSNLVIFLQRYDFQIVDISRNLRINNIKSFLFQCFKNEFLKKMFLYELFKKKKCYKNGVSNMYPIKIEF